MTPVRLEPGALRSRVKHSTTEPLRSLLSVRVSSKTTFYALIPKLKNLLVAQCFHGEIKNCLVEKGVLSQTKIKDFEDT